MVGISFASFKKKYLDRFKMYYRKADNKQQRDEIKRSVYDNPNLTEKQKNEFWELVIKNGKKTNER